MTKAYRADLHTREWQRIRLLVLNRDGWRCQVPKGGAICGKQLAPGGYATADHIKPHAEGGLSTPDNLRAACFACNSRLGARMKGSRRRRHWIMPKARASRF